MKNLLAHEKSPYLQQHADNPVHWLPWGDRAFELARERDVPVFVSIGYSTCHWCHVMAKESFSDEEVAGLLNRDFVSVKVDREERPDVDAVCMNVCQLMNGHGGWPLTLVMTPERKPFFAGTYIPKLSRGQGRPGLMDLLPLIAQTYREEPERVHSIVESVERAMRRLNRADPLEGSQSDGKTEPPNQPDRPDQPAPPERTPPASGQPPFDSSASVPSRVRWPGSLIGNDIANGKQMEAVERCAGHLLDAWDTHYGGFGQAPKFPTPHNLLFLLDYGARYGASKLLDAVRHTLKRMRYGGVYDQLGSGFHRYAVDRAWKIPHFEKMLLDQALLLLTYARCGALLGHRLSVRTTKELVGFVTREMTTAEGLFTTAIDADSEGEEGLFYTWSLNEIHRSLTLTESAFIEEIYHMRLEGNYLEERSGYPNGRNILYLTDDVTDHAGRLGMDEGHFQDLLDELRAKLLKIRDRRVRPATDDKILTDWNALMIHALVKAGEWLDEPGWVDTARGAWEALLKRVMVEGRLHHVYRDGGAAVPGLAMDHVAAALASLSLFENGHDPADLEFALRLQQEAEQRFGDPVRGGLFMAEADGGIPLGRQRDLIDTAAPSLNSLYGWLLHRLHRLTGRPELQERLQGCVELLMGWGESTEKIAPFLMRTILLENTSSADVVVCGRSDDPNLHRMVEVARSFHLLEPCVLVLHERNARELHALCPFTRSMEPGSRAWAALCVDHACQLPVHEAGELHRQLQAVSPARPPAT